MRYEVERVIERGDGGDDPDRLPGVPPEPTDPAWGVVEGNRVAFEAVGLLGAQPEYLGGASDLAAGLPDGLRALARDDCGEQVGPLADDLGGAAERFTTLPERPGWAGEHRIRDCAHGMVDIIRAAVGHMADHIPGTGVANLVSQAGVTPRPGPERAARRSPQGSEGGDIGHGRSK